MLRVRRMRDLRCCRHTGAGTPRLWLLRAGGEGGRGMSGLRWWVAQVGSGVVRARDQALARSARHGVVRAPGAVAWQARIRRRYATTRGERAPVTAALQPQRGRPTARRKPGHARRQGPPTDGGVAARVSPKAQGLVRAQSLHTAAGSIARGHWRENTQVKVASRAPICLVLLVRFGRFVV